MSIPIVSIPKAKVPTIIRRRIWSEFVPYQVLQSDQIQQWLSSRQIQLLVAVTKADLDALPALSQCCQRNQVDLGLWPMVNDDEGRWGSTFNAKVFAAHVRKVASLTTEPSTMAFDLEPPIHLLKKLLAFDIQAVRELFKSGTRKSGQKTLQDLLLEIKEKGWSTIAAANPMLLGDRPLKGAWQWMLGTPIEDMPFDAISFMAYTSLLEGYSRGFLNRRTSLGILAQTAKSSQKRWPGQASLSIGCVGGGALGDERPYRNIDELKEDIAAVRSHGIDDLALFDLSGILAQPNPQQWLDVFVHTQAADTPHQASVPASFLKLSVKGASQVIQLYRQLSQKDK